MPISRDTRLADALLLLGGGELIANNGVSLHACSSGAHTRGGSTVPPIHPHMFSHICTSPARPSYGLPLRKSASFPLFTEMKSHKQSI